MDDRKPAPKLGEILPPTVKELHERDDARWEETMVETVCTRLKISRPDRANMRQWSEREFGTSDLTFAAFHEVVPEFPVYFGCTVIRNLGKKVPVSALFMRFRHTPIFRAYEKLGESVPMTAGRHYLGLLFKWPNLVRAGESPTGLVLHNRPSPLGVSGTRLTWVLDQSSNPSTASDEPIRLFVTPLSVLLAEILAEKAWER